MGTKDSKDSNSQDAALFREAMRNVEPIEATRRSADKPEPKPKKLNRSTPATTDSATETGFGQRLLFKRPSVSKSRMRELSRGKIRIDAAIDLHGLTAGRAERELTNFLSECIDQNLRCIRIVHGKGYGSGERGPVLKAMTDTYLRSVDNVQAFCSARDNDGGTGAVYVLLNP